MTTFAIQAKRTAVNILLPVAAVTGHVEFGRRHTRCTVAGITTRLGMNTCEGKSRVAPMVKLNGLPGRGAVARGTVGGKATLVNVLVGVAGNAGGLHRFVGWRCVAGFAGRERMHASQRKLCFAVIKFHICAPGGCVVAVFAARAQLRLVHILFLMALETSGWQLRCRLLAMAIAAGRCVVGTRQFEFRELAVVESLAFPVVYGVAAFTRGAKAFGMHILQAVTVAAGLRQILVALTDMTRQAGSLGMSPHKFELCFVVVKSHSLRPVRGVVARRAVFAEIAKMRLVLVMTIKTG